MRSKFHKSFATTTGCDLEKPIHVDLRSSNGFKLCVCTTDLETMPKVPPYVVPALHDLLNEINIHPVNVSEIQRETSACARVCLVSWFKTLAASRVDPLIPSLLSFLPSSVVVIPLQVFAKLVTWTNMLHCKVNLHFPGPKFYNPVPSLSRSAGDSSSPLPPPCQTNEVECFRASLL